MIDREKRLTFALSKGRIFEESLPLLAAIGMRPEVDPEDSRKLIIPTKQSGVNILLVRASDVPTYVKHGAADLGIAGNDILVEQGVEGLYQPVDLRMAKCRMSVATKKNFEYQKLVRRGSRITVATKYSKIARAHFAGKGMHANVIKLYGSMELAPLVGLADVIVDLVSTGATLEANDLKEVEKIMEISARLVINKTALTSKGRLMKPLVSAIEKAVT